MTYSIKINYACEGFKHVLKKNYLYLCKEGIRKPLFIVNGVDNLEIYQTHSKEEDTFVCINGPRGDRKLIEFKFNQYGELEDRVDMQAMEIKQIGEDVFLLNNLNHGAIIYYANTKESFEFDTVYYNSAISNELDRSSVVVEKTYHSMYNSDITDTITYGFAPDSLSRVVTTNIYSRLRDKYIPVGNDLRFDETPFQEIIYEEIIQYLNQYGKEHPKTNSVLDNDGRINREFVKSLGKRK